MKNLRDDIERSPNVIIAETVSEVTMERRDDVLSARRLRG